MLAVEEEERFALPGARKLGPNEAEMMERLWLRDYTLNELLGGPLPPIIDPGTIQRVLDLGCGPGGWLCDLAERYPHLECFGIDKSERVLLHARRLRDERGLQERVHFRVHDPLALLKDQVCEPASFDLIDLRFSLGIFEREQYPALLRLCKQLCKPGGAILWTEAEFPHTTSLALEQLCNWVQDILRNERCAFTPGYMIGITTYPRYCLGAVGCEVVFDQSYGLEVSAGQPGNLLLQQETERVWQALQGWIVTNNRRHVNVSIYEYLYKMEEALEEMRGRYFCGICYLRTVVGRKPLDEE
jgi:SAM-dependent methyltransferase